MGLRRTMPRALSASPTGRTAGLLTILLVLAVAGLSDRRRLELWRLGGGRQGHDLADLLREFGDLTVQADPIDHAPTTLPPAIIRAGGAPALMVAAN